MESESTRVSFEGLTKRAARKRMRERLATLTQRHREQAGLDILSRLKPLVKNANCVFLFVGCKHEINTKYIDDFLRTQKIQRAYPCIAEKEMRALIVPNEVDSTSLSTDSYGIPSPRPEWPECDPKKVDIILVPGLAFSHEGCRLGQGGGYYDRALPKFTNAKRIAVGFDEQWVKSLPTDDHDQKIHTFVSNKRHVDVSPSRFESENPKEG